MNDDRVDTCVAYADLVGWTKYNEFTTQLGLVVSLFLSIKRRLADRNLTPIWKTSTGDGFAMLFNRRDEVLVVEAFSDLHESYRENGIPIRLAVATGPVFSFSNPLLDDTPDYCGPALITGRRLLDSITGGNVTLFEADFLRDLKSRLPGYIRRRFFEHPDVTDKHGNTYKVQALIADTDRRGRTLSTTPVPLPLDPFAARTRSSVASSDRWELRRIDGLIILWMTHSPAGLEAVAVQTSQRNERDVDPKTGLSKTLTGHIEKYKIETELTLRGKNLKKVWLSNYILPLSDTVSENTGLSLEIGTTSYLHSRSLEKAFEASDELRVEYESGSRNILYDLPNLTVMHSIIITSDNYLIFAQRKPKQVDFAAGAWSTSFEEQWDPQKDNRPHEVVLRGLREEFGISSARGLLVSIDNLWLMSLAREWGQYWNTALIYLIRAPLSAQAILNAWSSFPPPEDKEEHTAIAAVPLFNQEGRDFLLGLLDRNATISEDAISTVCGKNNLRGDIVGEKGVLHPSTGRMRILIALWAAGHLK